MKESETKANQTDTHNTHTMPLWASENRSATGPISFSAAVVGGDSRQVALAKYLSSHGCRVTLVGLGNVGILPDGMSISPSLTRAVEQAGVTRIILPLPTTRDGNTVWCPLDLDHSLSLDEVAAVLSPHMRLYGGRLPAAFLATLRSRGLFATDYYEDETLQIQNAQITAEGAVMTAMELTDYTIHGARMAVVGYGRIGQLLARMLLALGADVTVFARRSDALAWAEADGCRTAPLPASESDVRPERTASLRALCDGFDVIFNTVPARILGRDSWRIMTRKTLWVELASSPGGVDPEAARQASEQNGLRVVWAPSLPGRYAPVTAGEHIARLILSHSGNDEGRKDA